MAMEKETNEGEISIDLGAVFLFILRKWWIVLICLVVGLAGGFVLGTLLKHETYSTSATVAVVYYDSTSNEPSSPTTASSYIGNCVTFFQQNSFAAAVSDALAENGETVSEDTILSALTYSYSISSSSTSAQGSFIYITSTADSPELAYNILVAATDIMQEYIDSAFALPESIDLIFSLANRIDMPTTPVSDISVVRYTLIGGLGLTVLCIVVLAVIELADNRVKGEEDLVQKYNIAVLGSVPDFEDKELTKGGYYYGKKE